LRRKVDLIRGSDSFVAQELTLIAASPCELIGLHRILGGTRMTTGALIA
jgi:hypothetical protein